MLEETVVVKTGYYPRPHQEKLHASMKRFNVVVCHRRFGKTVFSLNEMVDKGFRNPLKKPQYAYIAPNYGQAKRVAWDMLKDIIKSIPNVTINEAELRIDVPRGEPHNDHVRYLLLGAENPGSIRGLYLDGAILDEFAECDPVIWSQVVRPALADRLGWAIFIGTPKGQNHFHDVLKTAQKNAEHWFYAIYKASETKIIHSSELMLARQEMAEEEYEQEFECSFTAALTGAYYGKQIEEAEKGNRIRSVPHDPSIVVDTYWDLGMDDTTTIWFIQSIGREFHAIDYHEMSGKGLDYYAGVLKDKSRDSKYVYGKHYWPHDGAARELGTGKARTDTMRDLGFIVEVQPRHHLSDGVHACRMVLPRTWFDSVKCERGVEALKNYQRKWDTKNKIFSETPLHNWASHGADGFRTFGMAYRDASRLMNRGDLPDKTDSEYSIFESSG